jgi:hypothetical protein
MNSIRDLLTILAIAGCAAGIALAKAIVERLTTRAATWLFPASQAVSFRLAWLLVRIASLIAPRRTYRFFGLGRTLEPVYQNRVFSWSAPDEARADLEEAYRENVRVPRPVQLVAPLISEAILLRCANIAHRFAGMFAAMLFCMIVAPPVCVWAISATVANLLKGKPHGNPWGFAGIPYALAVGPLFVYKALYQAITGRRLGL